MKTLLTQKEKANGLEAFRLLQVGYQRFKLWAYKNLYLLILVLSAGLGILLQVNLHKIDPLAAMVDTGIWVVVCYTLCCLVLFHLVSLSIVRLLLKMAKTYAQHSKPVRSWHLYFISGYFLVLYGFLYCLSLWM